MKKSTQDHLVSSYEATSSEFQSWDQRCAEIQNEVAQNLYRLIADAEEAYAPDFLHDRVHTESGVARPARSIKVDAGGAAKADTGKPALSLIPVEGLELAAQAFAYGAKKYGRNNFKKGHAYSRVLDAALRHLYAVARGEYTDAESGNAHLGHAIASLMMLAYHMQHHPQLDDLKGEGEKK